jgi:hypothetical protein
VVKTEYIVKEGKFVRQVTVNNGKIRLYPICDFTAWIVDEKYSDKEEPVFKYLKLAGVMYDGTPLSSFWYKVYRWNSFKQGLVSQIRCAWGIKAFIDLVPSNNVRHFKEAVKRYSIDKKTTKSSTISW